MSCFLDFLITILLGLSIVRLFEPSKVPEHPNRFFMISIGFDHYYL